MTSCKHSSCFHYLIRATLKDFSQYLNIQTVRKGRQIQRHLRFSAHGVYVA